MAKSYQVMDYTPPVAGVVSARRARERLWLCVVLVVAQRHSPRQVEGLSQVREPLTTLAIVPANPPSSDSPPNPAVCGTLSATRTGA